MPQIQDISIRYIKEEDYPEVLALAKIPVKAVVEPKPFEEGKIKSLFDKALINDSVTGIVLTIDTKVKGFILGIVTEHYFHSSLMAYCMAIFVEKKSRKYGIEMIKAFEAWAKYKKAEEIFISEYTSLSPKNLGKVYQRLGYSPKEFIYKKDI